MNGTNEKPEREYARIVERTRKQYNVGVTLGAAAIRDNCLLHLSKG